MKHLQRHCLPLLGAALLLTATGCSVLESDKIDYKSARQGNALEVPPDLSQLPAQSRYTMPGGSVSANAYLAGQPANANANTTAANQLGNVQYMRNDSERWLRVQRPADELWSPVRDFWLENGFLMALDQPQMGLMETDWAENRAKIPQDFIRSTIGRVFDSLYSTGERDKFRTRMERSADGVTDIFISHRGMSEEYSNNQRDSTIWKPRPRDPELENEFLRRLMVRLGGVSAEQAKAQIPDGSAVAAAPATAQLLNQGGQPVLQLSEDFDHAWRRVGLALDRTGFTVEDRDRSQGVYFVRYIDPSQPVQEPGFFAKLLGRSSKPLATEQYRIHLSGQAQTSMVRLLDSHGNAVAAAKAQAVLQVLADELQ